jgi:tetratricopeptide (TPR) repeat protein
MSVTDRVKVVMDSVKALVLSRDFDKVCQRLEAESAAAIYDERLADAASLSTMLGSFRSIAGDEEAALRAFQQAEDLDPDNPHHALATAAHLFFRLDREAEATAKVHGVVDRARLDLLAGYKAVVLLGRFAEADSRLEEAVGLLSEAHAIARSAALEPLWWDLALVRSLAERGAGTEVGSAYLKDLIERAEAVHDSRAREAASEILAHLRS